ncbi:Serine hydrolase [Sulfidibacter corallicola]|uniref:Serine hydrolase n=1 Tax=Sulfidibacter corallicola TaxID=2818388 RepID=A0A8A4TWM0_SULCO|nr:beta-lactamase family protein [Sulfidibacter corallicola]QTD54356.1 serine hydrolase [Sulfidibacter corallicola]
MCFSLFGFIFLASSVIQAEPNSNADARKQVEAYLQKLESRYGIAGQSVAILVDGTMVDSVWRGYANLEFEIPVDAETVFPVYSIAKLFANVTTMQLVEADKIDLDATLDTYLPDVPPTWSKITVRQAMSHLSGLPDFYTTDHLLPEEEGLVLPSVFGKPLLSEPGHANRYNQTNFFLVRNIIERVTGRRYLDVVRERMIRNPGLKQTSFGSQNAVVSRRASSYTGKAGRLRLNSGWDFPEYFFASAGLNTTAEDMAIWFKHLLDGRLIDRATLEVMWRPVKRNDGSLSFFANGWSFQRYEGITAVGHGGGGRNNVHHFRREADGRSVTVIYLTNGGLKWYPVYDIVNIIGNYYLPGIQSSSMALKHDMFDAIESDRWDLAQARYRRFRGAADTRGVDTENTLNALGYDILFMLDVKKALPVFELNLEMHPESANAHDSLGDALIRSGDPKSAVTVLNRGLMLAKKQAAGSRMIQTLEAHLAEARKLLNPKSTQAKTEQEKVP